MYTINIGLNNPVKNRNNSIDFTLSKALNYISDITNIRVSYDGEEPTIIIRYAFHTGSLVVLCAELDQDCIAQWDHHTGKGSLVGPNADQWGEFDLKYFQLP